MRLTEECVRYLRLWPCCGQMASRLMFEPRGRGLRAPVRPRTADLNETPSIESLVADPGRPAGSRGELRTATLGDDVMTIDQQRLTVP